MRNTVMEIVGNRIRNWRDRRNTLRTLSKLNDRTLRDIGVARHEIPAVVDELLLARSIADAHHLARYPDPSWRTRKA